ncbi:MAG: NAD(P)-dependent glycerol-3-phosphate dehydrogenase [Alphaproteobacteria bacterium]
MSDRIAIIGAGAWGTALAVTARRAGRPVMLWAHRPETAAAINRGHESPYLPGVVLEGGLTATTDPAEVLAGAEAVLLVVPAQTMREVTQRLAPHWRPGLPAVICAKGIERGSDALMSEVLAATLPEAVPAVLSGPSFATEVARGLPTAVTLACPDPVVGRRLVEALGTAAFRPYLSDDLRGAEIGGAVKNVLAIGCGIVQGRGLGDNARAALVTRGLAEIMRFARGIGARPETLMGLSGVGDLILTANSLQSRNFSLGVALGRGERLADVLAARTSVAEGVHSAAAVTGRAARLGVEMPICAAVDGVLNRAEDLDQVIRRLLGRPFANEVGFAPE